MSTASDTPNARLEALGNMTQETESANPDPAQAQAEQAEAEKASAADMSAKQWGMLMFTIGGACQMIAPDLKHVYTEQACLQWGQAANLVAEKYGWNGPSSMPEIVLIGSTLGFAIPSYMMMKASIKQAQAGNSPASLAAKIGMWWRTRKARKAPAAPVQAEETP
jgi:hypothetical protein